MLQKIEYTCPTCDEYYLIYDGEKPISPQKYAQLRTIVQKQIKLGYCKHCHRKDPNVPTTLEMDGVFTPEDIKNRNTVVIQCRQCKKWTVHPNYTTYGTHSLLPCTTCGKIDYDSTSLKSLRTYNPETDNKRRPKVKK